MSHVFYGKELTFNEKRHMYFWGGEHVKSVTTILGVIAKPMLIPWAANMVAEHIKANCPTLGVASPDFGYFVTPEALEFARKAHAKKKTDAGDAGSLVHKYAEDTLKGATPFAYPNETEEVVNGCKAFDKFRAEHDLKPINVERRIFSKRHMYAGTCDFYGHVDGKLAILDFKTSSGVWDEFWIQTAGYEEAIIEELFEPGADHLWRYLVHLDKSSGEFKLYGKPHEPSHREAWLNCVALDRVMQGLKKEDALQKKAEKVAA